MNNSKAVSLKKAEEFHGHLGPWLVLGLIAGEYILKNLNARKHFGIKITTYGLNKKPKTCLLDGLQLSSGCTMGKFNLMVNRDGPIKIVSVNTDTKKSITIRFKNDVLKLLDSVKDRKASECLARQLYIMKPQELILTN